MRRIMIAAVATLIMGVITIAPMKLRSNVQAKPVTNPPAPFFGDPCKNVKFSFTNVRPDKAKIRIEQVKYQMDGHNRTEDVHTSNDCLYDPTKKCITTGDNLTDAYDRKLSNFSIVFYYLAPNAGSNWSDRMETRTVTKT